MHCDNAPEHSMQEGGFEQMDSCVMVSLMPATSVPINDVGAGRLATAPDPSNDALWSSRDMRLAPDAPLG